MTTLFVINSPAQMPATAQAPSTSPPWTLRTISHIDWNQVNVAYLNMSKQSTSN